MHWVIEKIICISFHDQNIFLLHLFLKVNVENVEISETTAAVSGAMEHWASKWTASLLNSAVECENSWTWLIRSSPKEFLCKNFSNYRGSSVTSDKSDSLIDQEEKLQHFWFGCVFFQPSFLFFLTALFYVSLRFQEPFDYAWHDG